MLVYRAMLLRYAFKSRRKSCTVLLIILSLFQCPKSASCAVFSHRYSLSHMLLTLAATRRKMLSDLDQLKMFLS